MIQSTKSSYASTVFEMLNKTSEDIWSLITGRLQVVDQSILADMNEISEKKRDAVLAAQLLSQIGAAEWEKMSEKDRQRKIMEIKRLEAQSRKESKGSSAKKMLADFDGDQEAFSNYQEAERIRYRKTLDEKLKKLKDCVKNLS